MPVLFDGTLLADYHQFYLADAAADPALPLEWTDDALQARLLTGKGVLVVSTARNMEVPVRVELHETQPQIRIAEADHVAFGNFRTSGEIVVAGLTDYRPEARRAAVPAGNLCAMAISMGLGSLSPDGLEGRDRYAVHLWPCESEGVTVLRQWTGD